MRLICPTCTAQYEIDDSAIPDGGRDVECSSCGHAWFEAGPTVAAAPVAQAQPAPRPRNLDPAVADILRQEAEFEQAARRANASKAQPEPEQPSKRPDTKAATSPASTDQTPAKGPEFQRGFVAVIVIALVALAAYVFAPQIGAALPQAEPVLAQYVDAVDAARAWLNAQIRTYVPAIADVFNIQS